MTASDDISLVLCVPGSVELLFFNYLHKKDSLYASICADVGSLYLILVGILIFFGRQLNF